MTKPVIRLESAQADEWEIVARYAREAGIDLSLRFTEALRDTYRSIGDLDRRSARPATAISSASKACAAAR